MNTATHFTPEQGRIYIGRIGGAYKCLRLTPCGDAEMLRAEDGLILTVSDCRMYHNGEIDWCRAYGHRFAKILDAEALARDRLRLEQNK